MAGAEVEGGGFEHEAFEPDDRARGSLEDLGRWSGQLGLDLVSGRRGRMRKESVRIRRRGRENRHTASSGLVCSALGALKLCAAHKMSLLFLSVSSILHAAKSAAADASCPLCQFPIIRSRRET